MTINEIIYDILEIKDALEDDNDLAPLWILAKINSYRALFIAQQYAATHEIDPQWLQRIHKQEVTKINSADDPLIALTSIDLGKVVIPDLIYLQGDIGLYRVSGSSGILSFQPVEYSTLMLKLELKEEIMGEYGYCSRIGNNLYLYPVVMEMQAIIIPRNPLDIPINDNGVMRAMTLDDEYPVSADMAQMIIMEILTKDLALKQASVSDIVNDSQSQLKILKSDALQRQPNTQRSS